MRRRMRRSLKYGGVNYGINVEIFWNTEVQYLAKIIKIEDLKHGALVVFDL